MFSKNLAPESKVWVYQSSRNFTDVEANVIKQRINSFVNQWVSHGAKVEGDGALLYNRFVVLAADEYNVSLGGCSIDSSVHFIRQLAVDFNADFFDRWQVSYIQNNHVESCSREQFETLVLSGIVNDDTIVFNNLVANKQQLETKWKVAFKESWLKNLVPASTSFPSTL